MYDNKPPSAFQPTSRAHFTSQSSSGPMHAPSSSVSGSHAPPCSYIATYDDDDDDDELPPIPAHWASPMIATHCQAQPQSAAVVCAPPATTPKLLVRSTDDNARDYKWLTDVFANPRYDVRWNFNLCPDREADIRRRRDVALALMATRALHFESFPLEVIDEGLPAAFCCGGPLYDYPLDTIDGLAPIDEAEAERQWFLEELAFAEEEATAEEYELDPSYHRSDTSDEASSYEESLHTPTDESPMQDQDAPFSAESLKDELKQAIKALDRELHNVYASAHPQIVHESSSTTTHRHDIGPKYGAAASLAAVLSPLHLHHTAHRLTSQSQSPSTSRIDVKSVAMGILTWPVTLVTYAVSSFLPSTYT